MVLSQHRKFHQAKELALQLASLVSEGGMNCYEERYGLLKIIKDKWSKGESVTLSGKTV